MGGKVIKACISMTIAAVVCVVVSPLMGVNLTYAEEPQTLTAATSDLTSDVISDQDEGEPTPATGLWNNKTFYVVAVANGNVALSVQDSSKKLEGNIIVRSYDGYESQRWRLLWDEAMGGYLINNINSGRMLEIAGKKAKSGKNVIQYSKKKTGDISQIWAIEGNDKNGYVISSKMNSNIVLSLYKGKTQDGTSVKVETSKKTNGVQVEYQRWWFLSDAPASNVPAVSKRAKIANGVYSIRLASTKDKVVESVSNADASATIDLFRANDDMNQKWYVESLGKGLYCISSVNSGKVFEVESKSMFPYANVQQAKYKNGRNQKWILIYTGLKNNGSKVYNIVSYKSGMALQAVGAKNGSKFRVNFNRNNKSERFVLERTDFITEGFYSIGMKAKKSRVIDVPGISNKNNLQLEAVKYNGGRNQKVDVAKVGKNIYTLQMGNSGKYITDNNAGKIVQRTKSDNGYQKWRAVWDGSGIVFKNVKTNKYIYATDYLTPDGKLLLYSSQLKTPFLLTSQNIIDDGSYVVQTALSGGRVLDVNAASKASGAKLIFQDRIYDYSQKFIFTHKSKGYYKIVNMKSKKAVSLSGSTVVQNPYKGKADQLWQAKVSDNGNLVFVNKSNGKVLSLSGRNKSGANIAVKKRVDSEAQQWSLVVTAVLTKEQRHALNKFVKYGSNTNYAIAVNYSTHMLYLFERKNRNAEWFLKFETTCGHGAPEWPTPTGNLLMNGRKLYTEPDSWINSHTGLPYQTSFYYMTHAIKGNWIHTWLYRKYAGPNGQVVDKRVYGSFTNGCIRVKPKYALWIYNNIKRGTRFVSFY